MDEAVAQRSAASKCRRMTGRQVHERQPASGLLGPFAVKRTQQRRFAVLPVDRLGGSWEL